MYHYCYHMGINPLSEAIEHQKMSDSAARGFHRSACAALRWISQKAQARGAQNL